MKKCPFCAEEIQDAAIKCKHCGSSLTERPKYRDESAFGMAAIGLYILFVLALIFAAVEFGDSAFALLLSWSIVWSIVAASIGNKKGRPVRGFLLGLLLGPIGLLVVILQD